MLLPIVQFGNPVLRRKGARIEKITPEIARLIDDMIETMHDAAGVGLAAQQIGQALQLCVLDVREAKDRPSTLEIAGEPADVAAFMPLILINPQIKPMGDPEDGAEGCLSFPEVYGDIARPSHVEVNATNEKGERIAFKAGGLLSRAVQHEFDHLQGTLFIDRMSTKVRTEVQKEIDAIQAATKAALKK